MSWKSRATPVESSEPAKSGSWKDRATAVEPDISELDSAGRGLAQGASFGFADELAGGAEALWDKAIKGDQRALTDLYKQHRDESRANFDAAEKANPKSFMAGQVGGAIGTALVPGLGEANLAKLGAMGAAQGLGASKADLTEGDIAGAARDTAIGGGIGLATGLAGKGIQKLLPSAEQAVGSIINTAEDISNPLSSLPGRSYETLPGKVLGASEGTASRLNAIGSIPETAGQAVRKGTEALASGDLASVLGNAGKAATSKADVLASAVKGAGPRTAEQVMKPLGQKLTDTAIGAAVLPKMIAGPAIGAKVAGAGLQAVNSAVKNAANSLSVESISSLAPKLGKFGNALMSAAQRGQQSLSATHFVLQQTNPEYREAFKQATEQDNEE